MTKTRKRIPDRNHRNVLALAAGGVLAAALAGCVPLVVGGAAAVAGAGMVATDRRTSGAQLDDQGIELRGAARIREIANGDMNVTLVSYNRQVLMVGTVGSEADRRRAEETVRRVDNVRLTVNELVVGPGSTLPQRSNDTFVTGKVKASLLDEKDIFATSFKVVTEGGTVYLMGLATRRETDRATEIVRSVSGVQRVVRVVEIISDADLASGALPGGTGPAPVSDAGSGRTSSPPPSTPAAGSGSSSRVPLPPMEPLPPVTVTPVR